MDQPVEQETAEPSATHPRWPLALVTAVVFIVDQVTKYLVRKNMEEGEEIKLIGDFLSLHHIHNRGIAFGLFSGAGLWVVFGAVIVGFVLILTMTKLGTEDPMLAYGFALIAAGASGNIVDRLNQGYVTDMIQLPHFATFNVADMGITFGVILALISNLRSSRERIRQEHSGADPG